MPSYRFTGVVAKRFATLPIRGFIEPGTIVELPDPVTHPELEPVKAPRPKSEPAAEPTPEES